MKLSSREYKAMQMGWRKWWIQNIELKQFQKYGLEINGKDILEVGCGNGYAASLIAAKHSNSYTGIDIMEEQIRNARERHLENAEFLVGSATDLSMFRDQSFDAILDFCILHHVEGWPHFFDECHRVLKDDGSIYIADLSKKCIHIVDHLFHWGHAEGPLFTFDELEQEAHQRGFITAHKAIDLDLEGYFCFQKKNPGMREFHLL